MGKDILSEYGPGSSQPQRAGVSCGGVLPGETKDVMNYKPPQGPRGIMDPKSPGIHGSNHGNGDGSGMDSRRGSGSPGLGGTNHGCCGSQGRY